jgi:protein ImuA
VVRRLRHLIPAMERGRAKEAVAATFGIPEIDGRFPQGGLLGAALHEAAPATVDDGAAALGFAIAVLARSPLARGPLLFVVSKPALGDRLLYGPGLKGLGLDPARLTLVETRTDADALWALEEGLRSRALTGVVGFVGRDLDLKASRRLHLAAAASDVLFLLLRPPDGEGASAAATRWRIAASPGARDRFGCFERPGWQLALERCRNGRGGGWSVEWDHGAHRFGVVGAMADRALFADAGPERRRAGHRS